MATTWTLVLVLWLYTLTSHLQLFTATDIMIDTQKLQDEIKKPMPFSYKSISWDYLVLAMQWPQSTCFEFMEYNITCQVPKEVYEWTIHGLWPSKFDNKSVFNCNQSYPFDPAQIQDLLDEMDVHWPNLKTDEGNSTKFWAHEWNKHGTCATILPALAGEHNYFKTTMQLLEYFHIDNIFEAAKLVPSKSQIYKAVNFTLAINKTLNVNPVVSCYTTVKKTPTITYLKQLEICLNKTFHLIECPASVMGNCGDRDIMYPPINHDPVLHINSESLQNRL